MRMFSFETMVFPFWSMGALIHVLLACWLLISMDSPLSLKSGLEFFVVMGHMVIKVVYPILAFPKVRAIEIWYSMGTWMGLAPTMLTHAVLTSFKEKYCPCGRRAQWTSIGQKKEKFYKSQIGIVFIAATLLGLSAYRGTVCALAPDVPFDTCPAIDQPSQRTGLHEVNNYNCEFTIKDAGSLGSLCGLIEDDGSALYCYCCCEFSGQCGYVDKPEVGSMRPAGSPAPCDQLKTAGALLYASILLLLTTPWVHAVFRDLRRFSYDQGVTAQARVMEVALLKKSISTCMASRASSSASGQLSKSQNHALLFCSFRAAD